MAHKYLWRDPYAERAKMRGEGKVESPKVPKLPRVVLWRKGNWVVVQGPFPDPFYRSETRDSWEKAAKLITDNCYNRPGTSKEDAYAKVRAEDILEIDSGENEFGVVTP